MKRRSCSPAEGDAPSCRARSRSPGPDSPSSAVRPWGSFSGAVQCPDGAVLADSRARLRGSVQAVRRSGRKLLFVECRSDQPADGVVQLVLNAKYCGPDLVARLGQLLAVGDGLQAEGLVGRTRTGQDSLSLFVTQATLSQMREPARLLRLFSAVGDGSWSPEQAAEALGLTGQAQLIQTVAAALQPERTLKADKRREVEAGRLARKQALQAEPIRPEPARLDRLELMASRRHQDVLVVLENLANPSNGAAVLRSCDGFGVGRVFAVGAQVRLEERAVNRTSSSASRWVDVEQFATAASCFDRLEQLGYTSFATTMHSAASVSLYQTDWTQARVAVWFGNESSGLSEEALDRAQHHVHIEMQGMVESLNLAVSAGIVLSELWRQRTTVPPDISQQFKYSPGEQKSLVADMLKRSS